MSPFLLSLIPPFLSDETHIEHKRRIRNVSAHIPTHTSEYRAARPSCPMPRGVGEGVLLWRGDGEGGPLWRGVGAGAVHLKMYAVLVPAVSICSICAWHFSV